MSEIDLELETEEAAGLLPTDPIGAAEAVGLYYVMEGQAGIHRERRDEEFVYIDPRGKEVVSPKHLERIRKLVIPPGWTDVWICPRHNGHIQATGRDAKGRKQYRYHAQWNEIRSATKFGRLAQFGRALPALRARVEEDLRRPRLTRERVTALVVRLLEETLIRVGNDEYARHNSSYGLTTLLDEHVQVEGARVRMEFIGKKGKPYDIHVRDRRLASLLKRCQDLPGQRLFQYVGEDGECCQTVTSGDVNAYLREISGQDFTAKDFRTWGGTVRAAADLYALGPAPDEKTAEKNIIQVVKAAAAALGNTPAVCRKYYIHPLVLDAYRDGTLFQLLGSTDPAAVEDAVLKLLEGPGARTNSPL